MKTDRILTLFDSYADDLYRFAVSYTGSKQEAEDIVQDVTDHCSESTYFRYEPAGSDEMPAWADAALRSEDVQYY